LQTQDFAFLAELNEITIMPRKPASDYTEVFVDCVILEAKQGAD